MIALYNPWSTPSAKKPLPMSLLAVASMLGPWRDYEIVDGNLTADPVGRIVELGRARRLTAIGITVMPGPQLARAVPDSRRLKAALPDVPIVWGGYFPSQHADVILREDFVDFCVHSQGEHTFVDLMRTLEGGGSLSSIPGLVYKERGRVVHNPKRPLVALDELPDWPYESVPVDRYIARHYLGDRVGTHHSSFGCPFACNFCAVVDMVSRRWMPQSAERVARIVGLLRARYGIDAMQFHDMDFFISEARTAEFAERIRDWGLAWWALGRVDELMRYRDATWRTMKASGLKMVFCGAESGSAEMLQRMNKGGTVAPDMTIALARRMRDYDIVPEFSFVLGAPPDPDADVDRTIGFIRELKAANPATEIIMYIYTPVPLDGTLYADARALGFTFPSTLDGWVSGDWRDFGLRRDAHGPWFTRRLRRRVREFERVLNAYYPTVTDTRLPAGLRRLLHAMSAWRYHLRLYRFPVELHAMQRLVTYQRPETTGF